APSTATCPGSSRGCGCTAGRTSPRRSPSSAEHAGSDEPARRAPRRTRLGAMTGPAGGTVPAPRNVAPREDLVPVDPTIGVLEADMDLGRDLDLPAVLERFVAASKSLTGARYAAINIHDESGQSITFVQAGVRGAFADLAERGPHAVGVLAEIPPQGCLRLRDLREHPAFRGFPGGHPPMGSF